MATLQAGPLRARRNATAKRAHPLGPDIPDLRPQDRKQLCEQMMDRSQEYAEPKVKGRKRLIHQFTMTGRGIRFLCQIAHILGSLSLLAQQIRRNKAAYEQFRPSILAEQGHYKG